MLGNTLAEIMRAFLPFNGRKARKDVWKNLGTLNDTGFDVVEILL
jgi:hypothetical protein